MAATLERAPRVSAWVDLVDDLSGLEVAENGWIGRDRIPDRLAIFAGTGCEALFAQA